MLPLLFTAVLALESTSNTNKVLSLLPELASACPHNLPKCCSVLVDFSNSGGFCSPLAKSLLSNKYGLLKNVIKNGCRLIKPGQFPQVSCKDFESRTYADGTCLKTDIQLESDRIIGSMEWAREILAIGNLPGCFDFPAFEKALASKMVDEPVVMASHGLGTYKGLSLVAEYMSLLGPKVNKGFMSMIEIPGSTPRAKVTEKEIVIAAFVNITYFDGQYYSEQPGHDYFEGAFTFEGCSDKISVVEFPGRSRIDNRPSATSNIPSVAIQTARDVGFGPLSICKQHTKFCFGENKQYETEEECLEFISSLPIYSPVCGLASAYSGNSFICRGKHQFMVAINPEEHCPHIGYKHDMCSDDFCYNPGDPSLVRTEADETFQQVIYAHNQTISDEIARGEEWRFPDICRPEE